SFNTRPHFNPAPLRRIPSGTNVNCTGVMIGCTWFENPSPVKNSAPPAMPTSIIGLMRYEYVASILDALMGNPLSESVAVVLEKRVWSSLDVQENVTPTS